jgi:alpha-2-macroglobulin
MSLIATSVNTTRLFLTFAIALMVSAAAVLAQPSEFKHDGVARDAERYEKWLLENWKAPPESARASRLAGQRILDDKGDVRAASRHFATAVAADPQNPVGWLGLAESILAIAAEDMRGNERFNIPVNGSGAAYLAYQRSQSDVTKAKALAVLAQALVRRSYWRPALDAYKISLALQDDSSVRQAHDALHAERGFRVVNYAIDNETATPRLCIEFSESLKRGDVDFSKFVSVGGKDPRSVNAEGNQLCIDGLQHGERYEINLRAGLPAQENDTLAKTSDIAVYVRDRSPSVRFTGRNYVLPSRGQNGLPVVSINTGSVDVEIYRIGDRSLLSAVANGEIRRQLSRWDVNELTSRKAEKVYSGSMPVTSKLNEEVTTALPVGSALPKMEAGVYVAIARPGERHQDDSGSLATQWFVVSDLGLTAMSGDDGVHVFVRSLATTDAREGVAVRLVARNNEVLATATSDRNGYVRFDAGLGKGEGGLAPALLVAEASEGDYGFLDMATSAFDLSDRGVKGRSAPGPLDGFLYTDRGVYRPGEEVHLTGLVRDRNARAATVPITFIVTRPDGVIHRRIALGDQGLGGRTTTLGLTSVSMTGTWRVRMHVDPKADAIASAAFLVEDFVPEKLGLDLAAQSKQLVPGTPGAIKVAGKFLYGPPAANLALEGDVIVKATSRTVGNFEGYRFGLTDQHIDTVRKALEGLGRTDEKGEAILPVTLPAIPRTSRPLEATVLVRLREPGGRTIERQVHLPVASQGPRIGVKPLFDGTALEQGERARFHVIHLDSLDKQTAATGLKWELVRLDRTWQWFKRDGTWQYDAVTISRRVAGGAIDTLGDNPVEIGGEVSWGRYRLEVAAADPSGPATRILFTAGWYAGEDEDSPEVLSVALDKPSYEPGETAKLKVTSREAGKALISILGGGGLKSSREVAIPAGGSEVSIPVGDEWGAGVYVVASLYRSLDTANKRMPGRALGVAWLGLDTKPRTLDVTLDLPEKIKSGSTLTVPVKLGGLAAGEAARVTVAAVDVGILNLTGFKTPAPEGWFYAQRRLGVEIRDLYGRLIDGMRAERGALKSGGDGDGGIGMQGNPPVEESVALFSGIVTVGADGAAEVSFEMPRFNGTLRVMAVAWTDSKLGHADNSVIVRDAIAITAAAPRFLTLGDSSRLLFDVHNVEGPEGAYKLAVTGTTEAGVSAELLSREITLKAGERRSEELQIAPKHVGLFTYAVAVTGPDGINVTRELLLDVKPPAGDIRRTTVTALKPQGGSITLSPSMLTDLIPSRTKVSLSVGPIARMNVPYLLTQLDRYPYGCAEQTTSRALPLLYANALAVSTGQAEDAKLKETVKEAIDRVFAMQDSSGAFGAWGPSYTDMWLTSYVTDFLTRARDAGFEVEVNKFGQALDRLQNFIAYSQDFQKGGEARAYALYVLARNGRAPIGELRYYVDTRLDRFATPLAKAQLGAALAMMGDKARAERAFRAAIADLGDVSEPASRPDYGSGLRDGAGIITLVSETRILQEQAPSLVDTVSAALHSRAYTSTQEQAWLLLAAKAMADTAEATTLTVDGQAHRGRLRTLLTAHAVSTKPVVVANTGPEPVDAVVSIVGAALTPEPAVSNGFKIERAYYTLDGQQVDIASVNGGTASIEQSQRLVTVVTVTANDSGGRVLLVDRLPAGLEIENPRLVSGGDLAALSWLKPTVSLEHAAFRDDKFVAAFDFFRAGDQHRTATVAYIVRAVSPGTYVHPAATVEDMYRPDLHARTASGTLTITAKQ